MERQKLNSGLTLGFSNVVISFSLGLGFGSIDQTQLPAHQVEQIARKS